MKSCRKCGIRKSESDFYTHYKNKDGYTTVCKVCYCKRSLETRQKKSLEERKLKADLSYRRKIAKDPLFGYKCNLKYKFGISWDEYLEQTEKQGGKCAICGTTNTGNRKAKNLYVDHCHVTGAIRGLLCSGCNYGLGSFKDSADSMLRAIEYLKTGGVWKPPV